MGAVHGNDGAMDAFASVTAGTVSPVGFFDPSNIGRIMSAGTVRPPCMRRASAVIEVPPHGHRTA